MHHRSRRYLYLLLLTPLLFFSACAPPTVPPHVPVRPEPVEPEPPAAPLQPTTWEQLDGWEDDRLGEALSAFLASCRALRFREVWQDVCARAAGLDDAGNDEIRTFFEREFVPHRVINPDGTDEGLITGYYVPDLNGSRQPSERFAYPLYRPPEDLLVIDLDEVYPELDRMRLRGRIEGRRVVPYWDRSEIDGAAKPLAGQELVWVDDPVELFFLHIQGSGRINLDDGTQIMVNYGEQNGHPYQSIGKLLIERGAMDRHQMSMQNIRAWARDNPDDARQLLAENPSYVFFRELEPGVITPPGALGVPLTERRSLAVDRHVIPLGAPVFLATTWPGQEAALNRLMIAQDTGGAIKGAVRADFFWGVGDEAGYYAGRTKQTGRLWVLLPNDLVTEPAPQTARASQEK